jgi:arylsulfatase A-like enzyme
MDYLNRREFLTLMAGGTVAGAMPFGIDERGSSRREKSPERPNILFLLTDNQGWNMMGCAGNSIIHTPNMDKLANGGVRFSHAFVTTPICAASRASIFTGLYRRKHEFTFLTPPLRTQFTDISYPALLRAAGYRTGFIGKFGIESNGNLLVENEKVTLKKMFEHFDNFEHWGLFKGSPNGYLVEQPDRRPFSFGKTPTSPPKDSTKRHLTDITGDKAINFLRNCKSDQPFCLSISFNAPHAQDNDPRQYIWPESVDGLYQDVTIPEPKNSNPAFFDAQPEFLKTSLNRERWYLRFDTPEKFQRMMKGVYRMVSGVDVVIGKILEEIESLGMDKNTIIIFMSDNGMFFGERGFSDCWLIHEESIRVPLIVFDPRADKRVQGITPEQMVLNVDIAPTILELAGLEVPQEMQGRSLVSLLRGRKPEWRTDFLCEHLFEHPRIPKSEGVRTERWKYIRYFEQRPVYEELYDLENDPHEACNLVGDPKYVKELEQLRKRCDELLQRAK